MSETTETIALLREQSGQMRFQMKQIELKDQQIRLLKDTIGSLEEELDKVGKKNTFLKDQIKQFATQISTYNQEVITRVYDQNHSLSQQIQAKTTQINEIQSKHEFIAKRCMTFQRQLQQNRKQIDSLSNKCTILQEQRQQLQRQNDKLTNANSQINLKYQQNTHEIKCLSEQMSILTQKHHQSILQHQKKLKNVISIQQVQLFKMQVNATKQKQQNEIDSITAKCTALRVQLEQMNKNNTRLKRQMLTYKDKNSTLQVQSATTKTAIKIDLANVLSSMRLSKKITQFQSQFSDMLHQIYVFHRQEVQSNARREQYIAKKDEQIDVLKNECDNLRRAQQHTLKQHLQMKEEMREQLQYRSSQHENQVMQLAVKLQKQEIAIRKLREQQKDVINMEEQIQQLQKECSCLQQQRQQHALNLNAKQNTIKVQERQMNELRIQLQQTLQLCQRGIHEQHTAGKFKTVLHDALTIIVYLLHCIQGQTGCVKNVYAPFIRSVAYKQTSIKKLRKYVYAVIALIRIRKYRGNVVKRAIQNRRSIPGLQLHLANLSTMIEQGRDIFDLVEVGKDIYGWDCLTSYKEIILHSKWGNKHF